ncbi:response regulator transcription factor [Streptomyces sp. NPDC051569]|uniref:response regulator transcription factor n=1 Tax=Streptomyces sp. NPDC051569 TaxID=3365661 RepID=UPI0037A1C6C2
MQRVHLTGGPALVLDAYAHVIDDSADLTVHAQTPQLADALPLLLSARSDLLLIHTRALADAKPATTHLHLREAAAQTRTAVIGHLPSACFASCLSAGVTGILGPDLDVAHFLGALGLICRGGLVISPAPVPAGPAVATAPVLTVLSPRERQILGLAATHIHNDTLAHLLGLSPFTIKTHLNRVMRKLGATNRAHLVTIAYESGLVTPGSANHAHHRSGTRHSSPDPVTAWPAATNVAPW